ncbi:hypothetical protein [Enterovibrio calviensis]|nr:hypothetical protein [Enterovibrio calviensis]
MQPFAMHLWNDKKLDTLLDNCYKTDKRDKKLKITNAIHEYG